MPAQVRELTVSQLIQMHAARARNQATQAVLDLEVGSVAATHSGMVKDAPRLKSQFRKQLEKSIHG